MTPPDLLARLRGERAGHKRAGGSGGLAPYCEKCEEVSMGVFDWPCPAARALDCAIVLAEAVKKIRRQYLYEPRSVSVADQAWGGATRAYEGKNAEE